MILKDKIAVVTGAGQGIGRGIAKNLAEKGCSVVVADINIDNAEKVAQEIADMGVQSLAVKGDVSKKEEVDAFFAKVKEKFGEIDIMVNNAGIFPYKMFVEMTEEDWDKVIDTNLKGDFLCTQAALKIMKDGGRVINISSIASMVGFASLSHYCASKAGIVGLTRGLALEMAPRKITVNAVAPGPIETPGAAMPNEEAKQQTIAVIPLKRMGTPEDIGGAVSFLASDEASFITGQTIVVDGGMTVQ